MIKGIAALLAALPELIRFIMILQKQAKEAKINRKVKDDLIKITKAFEEKDASSLNDIFNNRS